ncbi:MAG: hypothetical protein JWO82_3769 [Akkermansiaceae bacterium]|nr:hypothetical protein [Akkermansiaceae bacterium]
MAIIYYADRVHNVFTGSGRYCSEWNFNHCREDEVTVFHCSGSGGGPYHFCRWPKRKPGPPDTAVWLSPGTMLGDSWTSHGRNGRPGPYATRCPRALRRVGIRLLRSPLWLGGSANPFEADRHWEGEAIWCNVCNDHREADSDNPCEHIFFCEECCWWGGPGSEDCKHERQEAQP